MFDKASSDSFWAFTVPPDTSREITGSSIYVHAFQTTGVTPGSEADFADPDFLVNRITEEKWLRSFTTCDVLVCLPEQ